MSAWQPPTSWCPIISSAWSGWRTCGRVPLSLRVLAKRETFRFWLPGPAMRAIAMIQVNRDFPDYGTRSAAWAREPFLEV